MIVDNQLFINTMRHISHIHFNIKQTCIPPKLESATSSGVLWQASTGHFLLDIPNVSRFLVVDGRCIFIDPAPNVADINVIRYLLMTPLAALLFQQGHLVLHAAAVANDKGAVLLAGDSGVGKSTILATLCQRGWLMLADELTLVTIDTLDKPTVHPICSDCILWPHTLKKLGIDAEMLPHADANRKEVSFLPSFSSASRPLQAIYCMSVDVSDEITMTDITGASRFRILGERLYNSHVADALLDRGEYMRSTSAAISPSVVMKRLQRPRGRWSAELLADLIEKDLS
jgi:hypothetical protein